MTSDTCSVAGCDNEATTATTGTAQFDDVLVHLNMRLCADHSAVIAESPGRYSIVPPPQSPPASCPACQGTGGPPAPGSQRFGSCRPCGGTGKLYEEVTDAP